MKEIWLRLKMESPLFFKRMTRVFAALFAVSLYLKTQDMDFHIFGVSLVDIGIGANAFTVFISSLTVKDKEELNTKLNEDNG